MLKLSSHAHHYHTVRQMNTTLPNILRDGKKKKKQLTHATLCSVDVSRYEF